jgi:minor extracellular serine protease Vpr
VVAAAGNAGPQPYVLGDPASAANSIAVAATDAHTTLPGEALGLNTGAAIEAQDSNGIPAGGSLPVMVLPDTTGKGVGGVSLGCDPAEYTAAGVTGKLVVTVRGTCGRVDRAIYGQQAGAAAVAMINTAAGYPPFEGTIHSNPDTGAKFTVIIPFLGLLATDAAAIKAAATTTLTANTITNPGFRTAASFSSGGPSYGDSQFKPGVTAPGVSVASTLVGSGNQSTTESGTSMATPHVAGVAALARQAHPHWDEQDLRAAVLESASPGGLVDYTPRIEGAGLVTAVGATATQVVASTEGGRVGALSFGFAELFRDFHAARELSITNHGHSPATFNVTATPVGGSPHTVTFSTTTVSVGGHDDASLRVTLAVPAATVGSTHDSSGNDAYQEVAGFVTLTPADPSMNNGVSLTIPYYLVPRARSDVRASLGGEDSAKTVRLTNRNGVISGNGDFYAWGLQSPPLGLTYFDPRAVGVQTNVFANPDKSLDSLLVFAVNTRTRFSNPARGEFDILVYLNGDAKPAFDVVAIDLGLATTGLANGQMVVAVFDLINGGPGLIQFLAEAPTDGSTVELPVFASSIGITPAHPRFTYTATASDNFDGVTVSLPGKASFNAFSPSVSNAMFLPVAPGGSVNVPITVDPVEFAKTPALGVMVVTEDNAAGSSQAHLLGLSRD